MMAVGEAGMVIHLVVLPAVWTILANGDGEFLPAIGNLRFSFLQVCGDSWRLWYSRSGFECYIVRPGFDWVGIIPPTIRKL